MLQVFDGELEKISLHKLLFLLTKMQEKAVYDFVPYKYGCYSFSAHADLTTMASKGHITDLASSYQIALKDDFLKSLSASDKSLIQQVKALYGKMSARTLMKHTYVNFPYWATKSEVATTILNAQQLSVIEKSKPQCSESILYTIGYEGISLEEYFNRLIKNDIKLLIDVRNNPLSMKYGFSKTSLQRFCIRLGISYEHLPELGILSHQRHELNSQDDYDKLFAQYRANNLRDTKTSQHKILQLLMSHTRVALTCFEANICQCHRKHLAESIQQLPEFKYKVQHI
ncbi:MAG: hypothetical protein RL660_718 [Bacteroidota bacterium]